MKNPTRKELIQLLNFIRDHNKKLNSDLTGTQMVNLFYSSNEELEYLIVYRDKRSKTVHKKRKTSNISQTLDWMYSFGWKLQSVVRSNSKHIEVYLSYKDQDVVHFFTINDTIKSRAAAIERAQSIMKR